MNVINGLNRTRMLIGFMAKKQHGKDTAADYLVQKYDYSKLSFADPLKEGCRQLFGFNDEQLYGGKKEEIDPFWGISPRTVLQFVGTDLCRREMDRIIPGIGNGFWVSSLKKKYIDMKKSNPNVKVVVSDVRFQNEVDAIHELGGTVVKVERTGFGENDKDNHESEKNIDLINDYDHLIKNDSSLASFYNKLDKMKDSLED